MLDRIPGAARAFPRATLAAFFASSLTVSLPITVSLAAAVPAWAQNTASAAYVGVGQGSFNTALEAPDGTLVVTGYGATSGAFVARLTADGQVIWSQELNDFTVLRDHAIAANGDILVCGGYQGGALAMRLGPAGDIVWKKVRPGFSSGGEDSVSPLFVTVMELSNGRIALGGYWNEQPCDFTYPLFATLDPQGDTVWFAYSGEGWITDVLELPSGDIAFVGTTEFYTTLAQLRIDGSLAASRVFPGLNGTRPQLAASSDGHLLIVPGAAPCVRPIHGTPRCFSPIDAAPGPPEVMKVDYQGTVLWRRTYGSEVGSAIDVKPTAGGGAIVLGQKRTGPGDGDLTLLRLDGMGDVLWQTVHGTPESEDVAGLSVASGGGFLCTGRVESPSLGLGVPFLLRTDANANVAGCVPEVGMATATDVATRSLFGAPFHQVQVLPLSTPDSTFTAGSLTAVNVCLAPSSVGMAYCDPAATNSSGLSAQMHVLGSAAVTSQDVTLTLTDAPAGTLGFFLVGMGTGTTSPPGSQGTICLAGNMIYRLSQLAQLTDGRGAFTVTLQGASIPGHGAILAGETWNFQAWFRDANPNVTSNLSHATSVVFL